MGILQKGLTEIANWWNRHLLLPNRMNTPSGGPDVMYFIHHLYETTDHMISNDTADTDEFIGITSVVYSLTSVMSLVSLQKRWWMKITSKCYMMHVMLLTCTYFFFSSNTVEEYSYTTWNICNFAGIRFCDFCIFAKLEN